MTDGNLPANLRDLALQAHQKKVAMAIRSPNDTRYPLVAIVSGMIAAAGLGAALLLAPFEWELWRTVALPAIAALGGLLVGSSIKFADQWERAVVLRLGRYRGLRGPGLFFVVPVVDRVSYHIDQRIRTTDFGAEPIAGSSKVVMAARATR